MSAADAAGNETEAAVREVKPSTPRSILRRDVPASSTAVEGATRKRVTFEGSLADDKPHSGGGKAARRSGSSSSASRAAARRSSGNARGLSLLRASPAYPAASANIHGGHSPPSVSRGGTSYDVRAPGRTRRAGCHSWGPQARSSASASPGDSAGLLSSAQGGGGGGGGRVPSSVVAAGATSSRGRRMFQVQEEMNRAARIAGAAAAAAAASPSASPSVSPDVSPSASPQPITAEASPSASPSVSPDVSPSASPQPITADNKRSPGQQREAAAVAVAAASPDAPPSPEQRDQQDEQRLRCSPTGSAASCISDTPHRAAVTTVPTDKATPRSSADDMAAVSAPKPPRMLHPPQRKQQRQQESPQGRQGLLSGAAAEAAPAATIGEVQVQDREELPPPPKQGVTAPSGSPISSPLRQGLQYREYAAGVSAASSPAKTTQGKDEDRSGSGGPTSSQRGEEHGGKDASAAAASVVSACAEAGRGAGVVESDDAPTKTALSASCPLVSSASVTPSGMQERPPRSGPESKSTWTSPKYLANPEDKGAAPGSTPSRSQNLLPVVTPPSDDQLGRTPTAQDAVSGGESGTADEDRSDGIGVCGGGGSEVDSVGGGTGNGNGNASGSSPNKPGGEKQQLRRTGGVRHRNTGAELSAVCSSPIDRQHHHPVLVDASPPLTTKAPTPTPSPGGNTAGPAVPSSGDGESGWRSTNRGDGESSELLGDDSAASSTLLPLPQPRLPRQPSPSPGLQKTRLLPTAAAAAAAAGGDDGGNATLADDAMVVDAEEAGVDRSVEPPEHEAEKRTATPARHPWTQTADPVDVQEPANATRQEDVETRTVRTGGSTLGRLPARPLGLSAAASAGVTAGTGGGGDRGRHKRLKRPSRKIMEIREGEKECASRSASSAATAAPAASAGETSGAEAQTSSGGEGIPVPAAEAVVAVEEEGAAGTRKRKRDQRARKVQATPPPPPPPPPASVGVVNTKTRPVLRLARTRRPGAGSASTRAARGGGGGGGRSSRSSSSSISGIDNPATINSGKRGASARLRRKVVVAPPPPPPSPLKIGSSVSSSKSAGPKAKVRPAPRATGGVGASPMMMGVSSDRRDSSCSGGGGRSGVAKGVTAPRASSVTESVIGWMAPALPLQPRFLGHQEQQSVASAGGPKSKKTAAGVAVVNKRVASPAVLSGASKRRKKKASLRDSGARGEQGSSATGGGSEVAAHRPVGVFGWMGLMFSRATGRSGK